MNAERARWLAVAGGALVALGSVLPWVTATSGLGTVSVAGTDGDGVITLAIGVLIALAAFPLGPVGRGRDAVTLLLALAVVGIGLFDLRAVLERVDQAQSDTIRASVGIGLWVLLAGGAVAVAGSFQAVTAQTRKPPPEGGGEGVALG